MQQLLIADIKINRLKQLEEKYQGIMQQLDEVMKEINDELRR